MTREYALQDDASKAWERLLVGFTEEGVKGRREFRLPVELVIATTCGKTWVVPAGTRVHLFCFITGEGATKDAFRTEGTFSLKGDDDLKDCDISILGKYKYVKPKENVPTRPPRPPAPYTRKVRITAHNLVPGGYALCNGRALSPLD